MNGEIHEIYLDRVNELMEKNFISKKEMANRLEMEYLTFWRKLNGKRSVDVVLLKKIAEILGTSVSYLMGETDDPASPRFNRKPKLPQNEETESANNNYLDLSYWGGVAENARKVAQTNDSRRSLVIALLSSALNELTGESTSSSINAYNGDNSFYKGNILNTGVVLA